MSPKEEHFEKLQTTILELIVSSEDTPWVGGEAEQARPASATGSDIDTECDH